MLMKILFLILSSFFYTECLGYIEKVSATGCESCTLRLFCREFDTIVAIKDIQFISSETATSLNNINNHFRSAAFPVQSRKALLHRCSGMNYCNFILTKDCPGASRLGLGNLTVEYLCVAAPKLTRYCNRDLRISPSKGKEIFEGFIHNPGYPRYYVGKEPCRWNIKVLPYQKIKITIFDVSLLVTDAENCTDVFQIKESEHYILSICSQEDSPLEIISEGNEIDITLTPSMKEEFIPRRGVLFHYTNIGCTTPVTPKGAHLVGRNVSTAEYSCSVGHIFPDTLSRTKFIKCEQNKWNEILPLPDCNDTVNVEAQTVNLIKNSDIYATKITMTDQSTLYEIVIPSIVILILFLINSLVVFIIYKFKKINKVDEIVTEEELHTLSNMPGSSIDQA